ncbi:ABC transporter ATP-binding protein [Campylobacter curvus]|uniref:ABC transporter ATP-binding protein n=1 Tax=Campylobacter curvus TaxID=200 RepID=UPI00037DBFB2|nr:ABC transporter ATP-binding protein [Campylobacter curvus]QKF60911.1 iron ABC transporter, ATP-binding protein [Campylobacter curvus]UEB49231.1 ABC transporter ATP-binding protein [Campylobacter curvus]
MVLKVENLSFSYGKKEIFKNLSLSLESGETLGILGRNGIGKSTLLKIILGLLKIQSGQIFIDNQNLQTLSNKTRAKLVGYVPQSENIAFSFKVRDLILMGINANIGIFARPSKEDEKIVEKVTDIVGVREFLDLNVDELSGGMTQLVLIARSLVLSPKILIMDEPTSYLDVFHQDAILSLIKRLNFEFKTCVIFTSHHPDHTLAVADKTLLLNGTSGFNFGITRQILTDENLTELFGIKFVNLRLDDKSRLLARWSV